MKKGTKLLLHRIAFPDKHPNEIDQFVAIEIIEVVKNVPDMWTGEEKHEGYVALGSDGEKYLCNPHSFPSDSITPNWTWNRENETDVELMEWYDVTYVWPVIRKPSFLNNEEFNFVEYCFSHGKLFYRIESGCFSCHLEQAYGKPHHRLIRDKVCGGWE
jgi:hypothetical protein